MIPNFRVWDKNFKRVCQVDFIDCQRQIATYHISELAIVTNPIKKIILMQSTGLKDFNGVEIYDGDILLSKASENQEDWKKWQVHYADGRFLIDYKQIPKDKRKRTNLELEDLCEDNIWLYGLVVIGNIYESTYLIESIFDEQRRTKMFMNLPSRDVVKRLREEYPEGTRVRLISMQDPSWLIGTMVVDYTFCMKSMYARRYNSRRKGNDEKRKRNSNLLKRKDNRSGKL